MHKKDMIKKGKLDIAIFVVSLSRGGAERVSVNLAEYFASQDKKVAIITGRKRKKGDYPVPEHVGYYCAAESSSNYFSLIFQYRKLIRELSPKTIIIMGTPLCCMAIPASLFTGVKVIVSERNSPKQFAGKKITKFLMNFWMKFADGYVFQTEEAKQYYSKKIQKKAIVIPNPIMTDELPERQGPFQKEVIGVGRLNPQKNWPLLINAFAKLSPDYPEWSLIIYGEGNQRIALEELIHSLGMDEKIYLPGEFDDVLEKESHAGIFVLPSNFEGMPNALMEAMAIGVPCIATDCPCGGPSELIDDGRNGLLIPVKNESALINAIQELFTKENKAMMIGEEARKVRDIYCISKIGLNWLNYLNYIFRGNNQ